MADARRIAVVGARSPLGARVLERLRARAGVECARGVETRASEEGDDAIDVVPLAPDHRAFVEYLASERIDTVVYCTLVPDRSGGGASRRDADVISTMRLGAAIAHEDAHVRCCVVASSSAVYPIDSHAESFRRERVDLLNGSDAHAASLLEAEDYVRDLAERAPHISVSILRLQEIAGPGANGALAALLAGRIVPVPIGFDPLVQLLHIDDAADALAFAAEAELAGLYHVASAGALHWSDAVRGTGRWSAPVLPIGASVLEPVLASLGLPFVPDVLAKRLRYGQVLDTAKLERTGWHPRHDQDDCIAALRS